MQQQDRATILRILSNELPYLQEHYGVEQIALFGSFVSGDATNISDVDIIVSLSKPLGLAFMQLADYLEEKLGRKVDLLTASTLERGIKDPRRAHIARNIQETMIYV